MKKAEFDFVVRHIVEEMVSYLVEDSHISLPDAFNQIYSSNLYMDIQRQKTHLYRYSPAYLYQKFMDESHVGLPSKAG